ncbi:hypothetical protein P3L10_023815 [Capsicum annuum]|uniref:uncharacterized protein LOC107879364 n=1 Tax=Capsicum annuum TaxID=4072 RepID=UPI001FB05F8B|nr:uncharacterized protein LOC107879364 [Capsicum annuum]
MKDYIRELGYSPNCKFSIRPPNSCILGDIDNDAILLTICKTLQNSVVLDVHVHMVEEESCDAFYEDVGTTENSVGIEIGGKEVGGPYLKNVVGAALNTAANITFTSNPITQNTVDPSDLVNHHIDSSDYDDNDYFVKGSDESSDDSTESENEKATNLLGDDDYGSNVYEEVKQLRAEQRAFLRKKRRERILTDNHEVPCGQAGPDLGFDETTPVRNNLEGRLVGDEPYYGSSDPGSYEADTDSSYLEEGDNLRLNLSRRRKRKKVVTDSVKHDPDSDIVM